VWPARCGGDDRDAGHNAHEDGLATKDTARPSPQPNRALTALCPKDAATLGDTNALLWQKNKVQRVSVTKAVWPQTRRQARREEGLSVTRGAGRRRRMTMRRLSVVLLLLCSPACAARSASVAADPTYEAAVRDAAVFSASRVYPLRAIPRGADTVNVVTWTAYPDSYRQANATLSFGDVWVTLEPEVRERCRDFDPTSRTERLYQLLGLPKGTEQRMFVSLRVRVADMFRPCPDADVFTTSCAAQPASAASTEHLAWMARQSFTAAQVPGGYPWTRLGYTYDWSPNARHRYGASEYVIRRSAVVEIIGPPQSTEEYCRDPRQ
jgi:hypothetical protein